ncbi:MAG: DEAD/DEAH box helicase [Terrimicrobiaceae bacterium]|jgi:ATP-dependent RNA helicase DeaD
MERPAFALLGLSPEVLKAVDKLGFEEASPIQAAAIPALMAGRDVVGQSQTGSGKTAAFAIPAIEKTDPSLAAVQVLVLCPTRELATQVAGEVHKLSVGKRGVHAVPVYGGSSFERQAQELRRGAQIVLGTPGRVIDHLQRGTLKLDRLRFIVLDEADRMLDMGFRDDIEKILGSVPAERQTAFFSATVSPQIRKLIDRHAREPVTLEIDRKKVEAPDITQWYYEMPPRMKFDALLRLIDFHAYRSGIIFCNTQRTVDELADDLQAQGIPSDRLHGGIAQAQRTRVMNKFKAGGFDFLVATDVAGRGIDVDDLELVVNFDLPYDPEDYVHRIGRTGRAGKQGVAVSFATGRDVHKIRFLERFTHSAIRRGKLPTAGEIGEKRTDALLERVRHTIESGSAQAQMVHVDRLLEEGADSTEVAAALFHILQGGEPAAPAAQPVMDAPPPSGRVTNDAPLPPDEPPRQAKPGRAWLRLAIGRGAVRNPRDIVNILVEGAGLAVREVGFISLGEEASYAEVPVDFANGLSPAGNALPTSRGDIAVWPVPAAPRKKRR